jgi:endonuclease IV
MSDPHQQPLGAHMSVAGGLHLAIERIQSLEGTALQIFTKNQRQWKSKPLTQMTSPCSKTSGPLGAATP